MSSHSASAADDPVAAEAADDVLVTGGSALGAVVAGFFAAAGAHSGVLLSPVTVLAAGPGLGARAFDGRCRQPGLGTKRPRGFQAGEAVPDAARVAVPASVGAVLVALAYDGQARVARVLKSAIRRARDSGADGRAEVLERIRSLGAGALTDTSFVRPMLHVASESEGGVLTRSDFRSITDIDAEAATRGSGEDRFLVAPWASAASFGTPEDQGTGHAVCAVDARGLFVALTYRRVMNGLLVEELELEAPLCASPVLRGKTRVAPGEPLPAPAPIAIRIDSSGAPIEVLAAPAAPEPTPEALASPRLRIRWDPVARRAEVVKATPK